MFFHIYVSVKSKLQHPPGATPGHLNFWKIFVQIPSSRGRKAVQMPHHRSIPDDQTPTPGKLFGSFYYAPEAVYVNLRGSIDRETPLLHAKDNVNGSWIPSLVQAFAFQPVRHESGIVRFECMKACLRHNFITPRGISATRNMKSGLAIKFPTANE